MNRPTIPEPELDKLLKEALKDDLPPEAEARMHRQFLNLKRTIGRTGSRAQAAEWRWMRGLFRKETLAVVSAVMMITGVVMQLGGSQSVLAHSIEQLKVIITVMASLNRAVSMECTVLKPEAGGESTSYHVFWRANGDARVDMVSAGGTQTIWISDETVSFAAADGSPARSMPLETLAPGSAWQPAVEFRNPALLARHMEGQYGLKQVGERSDTGSDEFLVIGREDRQDVEIAVEAKTYLPKFIRKYAPGSGGTKGDRVCLTEARFRWNQPISHELFVPGPPAGKR